MKYLNIDTLKNERLNIDYYKNLKNKEKKFIIFLIGRYNKDKSSFTSKIFEEFFQVCCEIIKRQEIIDKIEQSLSISKNKEYSEIFDLILNNFTIISSYDIFDELEIDDSLNFNDMINKKIFEELEDDQNNNKNIIFNSNTYYTKEYVDKILSLINKDKYRTIGIIFTHNTYYEDFNYKFVFNIPYNPFDDLYTYNVPMENLIV